jgi:hypothetical protein
MRAAATRLGSWVRGDAWGGERRSVRVMLPKRRSLMDWRLRFRFFVWSGARQASRLLPLLAGSATDALDDSRLTDTHLADKSAPERRGRRGGEMGARVREAGKSDIHLSSGAASTSHATGPRANTSAMMRASPRTRPYSATEALGKTSTSEQKPPLRVNVEHVRQVLIGVHVNASAGRLAHPPSLDSWEHAS